MNIWVKNTQKASKSNTKKIAYNRGRPNPLHDLGRYQDKLAESKHYNFDEVRDKSMTIVLECLVTQTSGWHILRLNIVSAQCTYRSTHTHFAAASRCALRTSGFCERFFLISSSEAPTIARLSFVVLRDLVTEYCHQGWRRGTTVGEYSSNTSISQTWLGVYVSHRIEKKCFFETE